MSQLLTWHCKVWMYQTQENIRWSGQRHCGMWIRCPNNKSQDLVIPSGPRGEAWHCCCLWGPFVKKSVRGYSRGHRRSVCSYKGVGSNIVLFCSRQWDNQVNCLRGRMSSWQCWLIDDKGKVTLHHTPIKSSHFTGQWPYDRNIIRNPAFAFSMPVLHHNIKYVVYCPISLRPNKGHPPY